MAKPEGEARWHRVSSALDDFLALKGLKRLIFLVS